MAPGLHEGLLRKVVGERIVAARQATQLVSHARLVRSH
jgi:hypothetical protein